MTHSLSALSSVHQYAVYCRLNQWRNTTTNRLCKREETERKSGSASEQICLRISHHNTDPECVTFLSGRETQSFLHLRVNKTLLYEHSSALCISHISVYVYLHKTCKYCHLVIEYFTVIFLPFPKHLHIHWNTSVMAVAFQSCFTGHHSQGLAELQTPSNIHWWQFINTLI